MAAVQPSTRTRGLYLFQLGTTKTRDQVAAWVESFRVKLPTQDATARLTGAMIGVKGGVVIEVYAAAPNTAVTKTVTALGTGTPAATVL